MESSPQLRHQHVDEPKEADSPVVEHRRDQNESKRGLATCHKCIYTRFLDHPWRLACVHASELFYFATLYDAWRFPPFHPQQGDDTCACPSRTRRFRPLRLALSPSLFLRPCHYHALGFAWHRYVLSFPTFPIPLTPLQLQSTWVGMAGELSLVGGPTGL